jgi:NhaA family Na+:H+ antiporter
LSRPTSTGTLLGRGSWPETSRVADILRKETVGGALLLVATVVAMVWANAPSADSYAALRGYEIGPEFLHLHLSLADWAAEGLLAIFFFVVGLELKREFVAGDLRDPRRAAVPILAAVGGMVAPAMVYVAINIRTGDSALRGWAIPTATDIAFAVAILAVTGSRLPAALRTFLLTLAVVDDLFAVTIIAAFYTSDLHLLPLLGALVPLALFAAAVQRQIRSWWLLLPLATATWAFVHASGIHATVGGVLLGLAVPVIRSEAAGGPHAGPGLAESFEHRFRPLSAAVAVPVYAFFAVGVTVGGISGIGASLTDRVALGIIAGLVVGKAAGVFGTTYLVSRLTRASLDPSLRWLDVLGVSLLAGIGFTVALLIGDLAFGPGSVRDEHVKVAVICGSVTASVLAGALLRARNGTYRRIAVDEAADRDGHGLPDSDEPP